MMRPASVLSLVFVLLACGDARQPEPPSPRDPQVAQALDDPLMTDPDLSTRNEGAAALTVEADGSLPVLRATSEDIAAARTEAARLVGGADRLVAPPPPDGKALVLRDRSHGAHLSALPRGASCASGLKVSAIWAARLPAPLPVYPRGATMSAAGSDTAGCRARVVGFTTPVPRDEVLTFYWTSARAARLVVAHGLSGGEHVLSGGRENLAFDLRASEQGGLTIVRLATLER